MAHTPINHPLRPLYRALAAIAGIYLIVFGVVGFIVGGDGHRVLGQGTNLLWCVVSLLVGAVVLGVTVLGRNLDAQINQYIGWALIVIAVYELATNRTDANFLDFTVSTVVVTIIVGLTLITSALYSKVGSEEDAHAEQLAAHGGA